MFCICISIVVMYLLFLPPLLLSDSPNGHCRCPCVRLRRRRPYPYFRASRKAVPLHLSLISPICLYLSICTRHMLLLRYNPIQLHSLPLSPLVVPSFILCSLYILYNSE